MSVLSNPEEFLRSREPEWQELASILAAQKSAKKRSGQDISRLGALYRAVCTDLVRAKRLGCAPNTIAHLDALVSRAHSQLYSHGRAPLFKLTDFFLRGFPRALRKNAFLFLISNILFWVPMGVSLVLTLTTEGFATKILPVGILEQMAEAYQHDVSKGRETGQDAMMAGFYVMNNVGLAFRCFATGILFGLGSTFFLLYNGIYMGAIFGHVYNEGGGINIFTFVCGHAGLELGAIVIAGAAGMHMGRALIVTHGRTRLGSLWAERQDILSQVLGAGFMLLLAALVEGFWSPSSAPHEVKWAVGAAWFVLLALYFTFAGRGLSRAERAAAQKLTGPQRGASQ